MKKITLIASAALLAVGVTSNASAGAFTIQSCPGEYEFAALKCGWDWHGYYKVKNFTTTAYDYYEAPEPGSPCLAALAELTSPQALGMQDCKQYSSWWLEESPGNALTDTHLLKRCVEDLGVC
jgi:hypothetical protein